MEVIKLFKKKPCSRCCHQKFKKNGDIIWYHNLKKPLRLPDMKVYCLMKKKIRVYNYGFPSDFLLYSHNYKSILNVLTLYELGRKNNDLMFYRNDKYNMFILFLKENLEYALKLIYIYYTRYDKEYHHIWKEDETLEGYKDIVYYMMNQLCEYNDKYIFHEIFFKGYIHSIPDLDLTKFENYRSVYNHLKKTKKVRFFYDKYAPYIKKSGDILLKIMEKTKEYKKLSEKIKPEIKSFSEIDILSLIKKYVSKDDQEKMQKNLLELFEKK